ncbi:hypothetical protein BT96DRAFT_943805 [Gymnopus androsaceus JB14]|uniref:Uncharacterized protein n=1 Tax=Gymnopus androsaceus JB14 TaxID=1447944 RepID=A0A6A4H890_9AGAR|nr:hypothetical protein BT96DRAFT_943805 [Gymnopus androsaceus JB14]
MDSPDVPDTNAESPKDLPEIKIPSHFVKVDLPHCDTRLFGTVFQTPHHNQALGKHAKGNKAVLFLRVPHSLHHDPETLDHLIKLRDHLYGPDNEHRAGKGGIAIEQYKWLINLSSGDQAYPFGNTFQTQRMMEFVGTNHKLCGPGLKEDHDIYREFLKLNVASAKFAAPEAINEENTKESQEENPTQLACKQRMSTWEIVAKEVSDTEPAQEPVLHASVHRKFDNLIQLQKTNGPTLREVDDVGAADMVELLSGWEQKSLTFGRA